MKTFKDFCYKNGLMSRLFISDLVIGMPADAITEIDIATIREFFEVCGFRKLRLVDEWHVLTTIVSDYVSVIRTCRMIVIRYIKSDVIKNTMYIDKGDYTAEELRKFIRDLHSDCVNEDIPVFYTGKDFKINIGTYVSPDEILNNLEIVLKRFK